MKRDAQKLSKDEMLWQRQQTDAKEWKRQNGAYTFIGLSYNTHKNVLFSGSLLIPTYQRIQV